MLISENLASAIWEQISHERYNSNLYLFVCGYLRNKGLNNLAKHFEEQHQEEINHSKMFFDLLTDMNTEVKMLEIDGCDLTFANIMDVATAYFEREVQTTNSINEIKKLAIEEDNPVVEEFMRKMIVLQQAEYAEATDFQDKALLTGGDWKFVMLWDIGLG
jgi:ferritin